MTTPTPLRRVKRARKEITRALEAYDERYQKTEQTHLRLGEVAWLRRAVAELRHAEDQLKAAR